MINKVFTPPPKIQITPNLGVRPHDRQHPRDGQGMVSRRPSRRQHLYEYISREPSDALWRHLGALGTWARTRWSGRDGQRLFRSFGGRRRKTALSVPYRDAHTHAHDENLAGRDDAAGMASAKSSVFVSIRGWRSNNILRSILAWRGRQLRAQQFAALRDLLYVAAHGLIIDAGGVCP